MALSDRLFETLEKASPTGSTDFFALPMEDDLGRIPQDPNNPLSPEKVALGKQLFHETGFALAPIREIGKGTYSCASCHFASAGFQAGRWQGIGDGGSGFGLNGEGRVPMLSIYSGTELDVQPIRSPSAMNGAWQEVTLWNGQFGGTGINKGTEHSWGEETPKVVNHLGYEGLESQAIAGLKVHRMEISREAVESLGYLEQFDEVFADWPEGERYNRETAGLAIAAYERTLLSNQAPFQQWLRGNDNAMTDQELRGAIIFFDQQRGNCVSCHTGPALSSMEFHALGMDDLHDCPESVFLTSTDGPEVFGRGGFTGRPEDNYKFKVPQLYNLADSPFYGHGSSFRSLEEVISYKNQAVPQKEEVPSIQLAADFTPLGLTAIEVRNVVAFLEKSLYDAHLDRYVPDELPSGNCLVFGDEAAKKDLGCD